MKLIAEQLNAFVAARYRWSAGATGDKITIRNAKGQVCGTVAISNGTLEVENVMAGRQNLMGALAKREIREHVQGLLAAMLDAAAKSATEEPRKELKAAQAAVYTCDKCKFVVDGGAVAHSPEQCAENTAAEEQYWSTPAAQRNNEWSPRLRARLNSRDVGKVLDATERTSMNTADRRGYQELWPGEEETE